MLISVSDQIGKDKVTNSETKKANRLIENQLEYDNKSDSAIRRKGVGGKVSVCMSAEVRKQSDCVRM